MCVVFAAHGQHQAFRETPEDTDVVEGGTVILKCAVDHRKGEVQWVKDGELLGTTRSSSTQDAHAQHKQMGPVDVNRSVHTAHKQHQRKNIRICTRRVPPPVWIGPKK